MTEPIEPIDLTDETVDESFPASDPPAWTGAHAGPPVGHGARQTASLRSIRSSLSVDEAIARVEHAVVGAGMKVFARIDQAAEARAVGLSMRPAVLILFGNPKGGTPLMIAQPTVAIDLPLKALAWQDGDGETWVSYNTPALLVERHGLDAGLAARLAPAGEVVEKAAQG
jgi:uncharacterized protein (DUF302 family)